MIPHKNKRREKRPRRLAGTYSGRTPGVKEKQAENGRNLKDLAPFWPPGPGLPEFWPVYNQGVTESSAVVHSAIEEFAQELAYVTRSFLKTEAWAKTERSNLDRLG